MLQLSNVNPNACFVVFELTHHHASGSRMNGSARRICCGLPAFALPFSFGFTLEKCQQVGVEGKMSMVIALRFASSSGLPANIVDLKSYSSAVYRYDDDVRHKINTTKTVKTEHTTHIQQQQRTGPHLLSPFCSNPFATKGSGARLTRTPLFTSGMKRTVRMSFSQMMPRAISEATRRRRQEEEHICSMVRNERRFFGVLVDS